MPDLLPVLSPTAPLVLRRAEAADVSVLLRLKYLVAHQRPEDQEMLDISDWSWIDRNLPELTAEFGPLSYSNYLVAIIGSLIVGAVCINWFDKARRGSIAYPADQLLGLVPNSMLISDMAVFSRFRRAGIGSRMMQAAEDNAKALGIRRVVLMVESTNAAALALYRKFGFRRRAARRLPGDGEFARPSQLTLMIRATGSARKSRY